MGDLLRAAGRERNDVMWTQFVRLETIMLDSIELLADRTRVYFAYISNLLEERAKRLRSLSQTFVDKGFDAIV